MNVSEAKQAAQRLLNECDISAESDSQLAIDIRTVCNAMTELQAIMAGPASTVRKGDWPIWDKALSLTQPQKPNNIL